MTKVERHKQLCEELNQIYEKKNHDYGDSFHATWIEEGYSMARIRLSDKLNRFKTLSRANADAKVSDESLRDTLMDLANYAIMTVLEMEDVDYDIEQFYVDDKKYSNSEGCCDSSCQCKRDANLFKKLKIHCDDNNGTFSTDKIQECMYKVFPNAGKAVDFKVGYDEQGSMLPVYVFKTKDGAYSCLVNTLGCGDYDLYFRVGDLLGKKSDISNKTPQNY